MHESIWKGDQPTAEQVCDLIHECYPFFQRVPRREAVSMLREVSQKLGHDVQLLRQGEKLCGLSLFGEGPNDDSARLTICVAGESRRQGYGRALLRSAVQDFRLNASRSSIVVNSTRECPAGIALLESEGFSVVDEICWSARDASKAFPQWVQARVDHLEALGLSVLTGAEFESQTPNWDRLLWQLHTESAEDIPSNLGHELPAFDAWRAMQDTPFANRANAIIAMEGGLPIGFLNLGENIDGTANVNFTGVARSHRRRGVSSVLKQKASLHAQKSGIKRLMTQNHKNNPIYDLNLALGFEHVATMVEFVRRIER